MSALPTTEEAEAVAAGVVAAAAAGGPDDALAGARVGDALVVHTLGGAPSYLLVPLWLRDGGHGFVRVLPGGGVGAAGRFGRAGAAELSAADAAGAAGAWLRAGEEPAEPVLVHDGPPGREAWLVAVRAGGAPARWLFVTPAGVYERRAGEIPDPELE